MEAETEGEEVGLVVDTMDAEGDALGEVAVGTEKSMLTGWKMGQGCRWAGQGLMVKRHTCNMHGNVRVCDKKIYPQNGPQWS